MQTVFFGKLVAFNAFKGQVKKRPCQPRILKNHNDHRSAVKPYIPKVGGAMHGCLYNAIPTQASSNFISLLVTQQKVVVLKMVTMPQES